MSEETSGNRSVYLPPEDFADRKLPVVALEVTDWVRIHLDVHGPLFFSRNRNHRFSPVGGKHAVMYAAGDFNTAFLEVFGDTVLSRNECIGACLSAQRWGRSVRSIISIRELKLCDLTTPEARTAVSVDLATLMHSDLTIPQQWSEAVMNHPEDVDGILYPSRFTGESCLALFDVGKKIAVEAPIQFPHCEDALAILDELAIALV
ncbi:MAG: RES family NAD+ phosphorylase [Akkermansiaceae bacterium]